MTIYVIAIMYPIVVTLSKQLWRYKKMDKILDFLVLDPVTDYKPCIRLKVSQKVQTLMRIACDLIIMLVCLWFMKDKEIGTILLQTISVLLVPELLLKGIHSFTYFIDILLHIATKVVLLLITFVCTSSFIWVVILLGVNYFSSIWFNNLYHLEKIEHKDLEEWWDYSERNQKIMIITMSIFYLVGWGIMKW